MRTHKTLTSFFILSVALVVLYANTLHSPWVLDDEQNILNNKPIHLNKLTFQTLTDTFYASPVSPGTLYRPLSCASFAVNWFIGQDNVVGYHIANISIHILTAFFLYLVCLQLIQLPACPDISYLSAHSIALLASLLWATNPVQTQAVTYIVQRMASLAALFSIIGIYFFLKARTNSTLNKKLLFASFGCLLSFFCALASKENAIIFPLSLLLIECIFFRAQNKILHFAQQHKTLRLFIFIGLTGCIVAGTIYIVVPYLNYDNRTFTLTQRILTEPRIIVFYLSQLFFPIPSRLSLEHDIVLSTSLLTPWMTIPAICSCLALISIGFATVKKIPLLSLPLLFYFLNHAVESTVIPLEIVFEHRNYLPSFFLFLPIAAWWIHLIDNRDTKYYYYRPVLIISAISLLIFFGINTHIRNQAWSSEINLWQDTYQKAPNSNRTANNLAKEYIQSGDLDKAFFLAQRSYNFPQPSKNHGEAVSLNAQGVIYHHKGNEQKATQLFQQSLLFLPEYTEARNNLIVSLCKQSRYQEALAQFSLTGENILYHNPHMQGVVLLRLQQPTKALAILQSVSQQEILSLEIITGIGKALSMIGNYQQADFFLRQAAKFSSRSALIYIENFLLAGQLVEAADACKQMLTRYPAETIFRDLSTDAPADYPLSKQLVAPFVQEQARQLRPSQS